MYGIPRFLLLRARRPCTLHVRSIKSVIHLGDDVTDPLTAQHFDIPLIHWARPRPLVTGISGFPKRELLVVCAELELHKRA